MQVMVYLQRHQSLTSAEEVEYDASSKLVHRAHLARASGFEISWY